MIMTMTAPRFVDVTNDCKLKCCPNFTDNVKCTEMYIHNSCICMLFDDMNKFN